MFDGNVIPRIFFSTSEGIKMRRIFLWLQLEKSYNVIITPFIASKHRYDNIISLLRFFGEPPLPYANAGKSAASAVRGYSRR